MQRLVRSRVLRQLSGSQSSWAGARPAQSLARRIVAAPCESFTVLGAVQHSSEFSVCRLWISRGVQSLTLALGSIPMLMASSRAEPRFIKETTRRSDRSPSSWDHLQESRLPRRETARAVETVQQMVFQYVTSALAIHSQVIPSSPSTKNQDRADSEVHASKKRPASS